MKTLYAALVVFLLPITLLAGPKRAPRPPTTPFPADGAINVATQVTVTASAVWATSCDLYFDAETYRTASTCGFIVLTAPGTSHTWHVVARNAYGSTLGPNWHFITAASAPPPPPPSPVPVPIPTSGYGPQSTIVCPAGSIDIQPGASIQTVVNTYTGWTTFCIRAGTHQRTSSITPKTGDIFIGEYGAILDGTGWVSTDQTQAAFRAHNEDIDTVTIRNLIIRNMPQKCIHAFRDYSSGWIIQNNTVTGCKTGLSLSSDATVTNNIITRNVGDVTNPDAGLRGGGYVFNEGSHILVEHNEISYNGPEQKSINIQTITWRNNFVHHNLGGGIWCDGDCDQSLVEGNTVEDNIVNIWWEGGRNSIIRNNFVRRAAEQGVFLSTSKNIEVMGNTLEGNQFSIHVFVDLDIIGFYAWSDDLADNWIHGNTVRIPAGGYGGLFSRIGSRVSPVAYVTNTKNNRFEANIYYVAAGAAAWLWEIPKSWVEWQALPQDVTGTIQP